jgi:hypothetical protein
LGSTYAEHPTTVSVGPYSFISRTPGACSCQNRVGSATRLSAPITSVRVAPRASSGVSRGVSSDRWMGVILMSPKPGFWRSTAASASTGCSSGSRCTGWPANSGSRLVTVRSTAMDENTGAPDPWSAPYARTPQWM